MSSLWMGLERVVDRLPKRRPWNPVLKDKMDMSGAPGALLSMEEVMSSCEKSAEAPPRCCWRFHIKAAL